MQSLLLLSSLRLVFDEQLFREALALYEGTHDFTEFCKAHSRGRVVERVGVTIVFSIPL